MKKCKDAELESLLDRDPCQTQSELTSLCNMHLKFFFLFYFDKRVELDHIYLYLFLGYVIVKNFIAPLYGSANTEWEQIIFGRQNA